MPEDLEEAPPNSVHWIVVRPTSVWPMELGNARKMAPTLLGSGLGNPGGC